MSRSAVVRRAVASLTLAALAFAGGIGVAQAADAAAPAGKRQFGTGKPQGSLDRNALRTCLNEQARIKSLADAYADSGQALEAKKDEVARFEAALKDEVATLDRTQQAAVDAFNAKVQQRDRMIEDYNAAVPAFNQQGEALKAQREAWVQACGNRSYDEIDYYAIQRENKKK